MEKYIEFLNRINSFERPNMDLECGFFSPNNALLQKVDSENHFKSFFGDTIVFDLKNNDKQMISKMVDVLYKTVPECFCDRLVSNTLHMTLHDLNNSTSLNEISLELFENEIKLIKIIKENYTENSVIRMKSNNIFNMVGISLVLGLCPATEKDYDELIRLYNLIDNVKTLPYHFTPHITLAYYNSNGFSQQSKEKLESIVSQMNKNEFEIKLNLKDLVYQKFTSMNNYFTIFRIINKV